MPERPGEPPARGGGPRDGWDPYRNVLALRRLGFSLDEMARLTMGDFVALTDIAAGNVAGGGAPGAEKARSATQTDIDALLG